MPLIGPLMLTLWIMLTGTSRLWIPVVWLADLGTMLFLFVVPQFVREEWRNSTWTRVLHFEGIRRGGRRRGTLFLQAGGRYLLQIMEPRVENEVRLGICSISEPGTYLPQEGGTGYDLVSHTGQRRAISRELDGSYCSTEIDPQDAEDLRSIDGWRWRSVR